MANNPHYERLGGEAAVRKLVERFYAHMEALPEAASVRRMHPTDLAQARERLFLFLTGWLGGPPLYAEKYGPPKLRAVHMPFPIGTAERDQWMLCINKALDDPGIAEDLKTELSAAFARTADFMRNQPGRPAFSPDESLGLLFHRESRWVDSARRAVHGG